MKRLIVSFSIIISLLVINSINVLADNKFLNANVQLIGDANGIVFLDDVEYFLLAKNMMPGDKITGDILLENKYNSSYEIYIRAERITREEEFDLLSKINLVISEEGKLIYNGIVSGKNGLENNIKICELQPGEKKNINAIAILDGNNTGNEYKNKFAEVKWIFTAINKEDNTGGLDKNNNLPQTGNEFIFIKITLALISIISGIIIIKSKKIKLNISY